MADNLFPHHHQQQHHHHPVAVVEEEEQGCIITDKPPPTLPEGAKQDDDKNEEAPISGSTTTIISSSSSNNEPATTTSGVRSPAVFQDIGYGKLYNVPSSQRKGPTTFGSSKTSNFQFHQIPVPHSGRTRNRGSKESGGSVIGRGGGGGQQNNTFLERFRSQTSIPEVVNNSYSSSHTQDSKLTRNGSSLSMLTTDPIDVFPPSSPYLCQQGTSSSQAYNGQGVSYTSNSHTTSSHHGNTTPTPKPKKWFSFTNLLNRQNLSSLLNIPKSRLSVSSTLNSVFVGPGNNSPSPSGSESGGSNVFFGLNFSPFDKGHGSSGGGGIQSQPSSHSNYPISPSHSCYAAPVSTSGDYSSSQNQVVFRRKSGSGGFAERRSHSERSSASTSSSIGGGGSTFMKHYSSGNASESDRSSGVGYYTVNSGGAGPPSSSGSGSNRLSCGEFFTGTPNSPICSGERETEFQWQQNNKVGGVGGGGGGGNPSLSGFSSRNGESSSYSRDFYHFHKTLGRSLPTLLESMESGIASQSSSEGGGGSTSCHYSVDSVMDLMQQEFVVLTGSKSLDDHYILTFPDRGNFHLLGDEDYRRLMIYLTAVPPMHDSESGFVIIVDRRNDKWNSVKTTLVRISNYFPALIHRVFVLRPVGIFQKALSEISSKLFRTENLRFRLTVCNNISDLFAYVEPSQLTLDLGGSIAYDRVKWVTQRVEVEAFHQALQSLSRDLKAFTEVFHDLEYPNDVVSTEGLLSDKHSEFQRLRNDLTLAIDHGEHLLFRIKDMCYNPSPQRDTGNGGIINNGNGRKNGGGGGGDIKNYQKGGGNKSMHRSNSSVQLINVISVERYIVQIEETARLFEDFWLKEKMSLEQCLQLRRFEHDFREMQATFDIGMKRLDELGEVGESLTATDLLISETSAFEIASADDVSRAQELERIGKEIVESNQSAVDSVEPKCYELSRMTSQFRILLQDKISKQKDWREIQAVIEKANQICNEGMDLMSCQIISEQSGGEDSTDSGSSCGSALILRIDEFLERIRTMREELSCFKTTPTSPTGNQSKPLVKQVLRRVEDVEVMCIKRKSIIVQQLAKLTKSRRSSGSSFASTPSNGSQNLYASELKSAKSTSQLDTTNEDYSSPTSLRSGSSTLSLDGSGNNGFSGNPKLSADWEIKKIKRGHVINELMQTERSYVEEIGEILAEYRDQISNPEARSLLPQQLQPIITPTKLQRKNPSVAVLFCNLDEIHAFHAKSFLPDLSNCVESIELVGLCFIQRHSDFLSMYSQYCQLLPASEILRKEIGENHPWFVACRNRLGHKLPLGAYLLKPVQRITKYHLLLKDLIKSSEGCEGYPELLEALECMLVVLRCVNDGMHQLGITGYPGKLIEEGYLLLQGSFLLWTDNKKDRLRLKGHQRHLFLYQRSVLICKKVPKSSLYEFRNKLSLSEIGLTEALKGSGASKKFEIWINGRQKVYLLQAESTEAKEIWVREIKKLLLEQLESIRATKSQTIAACAAGASAMSVASSNLQPLTAARRQKMMGKGITVNGWRTTNVGHRPLRQVSSWDNPDVVPRPKSRISNECDIDEDIWSCSEMSNSDDDDSTATPPSRPLSMGEEPVGMKYVENVYGVGENVENSPKYIVLADYGPMGAAEVLLKEGDIVSLVKVGCGGWWFVKILHSTAAAIGPMEGWAPAAYLEKFNVNGNSKQNVESSLSSKSEHSAIPPGGGNSNVLAVSSKSNQIVNKDLNQFLLSQGQGRSASIPGSSRSSSSSSSIQNPLSQRQALSQSTEDILSALR